MFGRRPVLATLVETELTEETDRTSPGTQDLRVRLVMAGDGPVGNGLSGPVVALGRWHLGGRGLGRDIRGVMTPNVGNTLPLDTTPKVPSSGVPSLPRNVRRAVTPSMYNMTAALHIVLGMIFLS